jgi:hypothetical protein
MKTKINIEDQYLINIFINIFINILLGYPFIYPIFNNRQKILIGDDKLKLKILISTLYRHSKV